MARHSEYSVNLAPQPRTIGRAYTDLILAYDWRRVTRGYYIYISIFYIYISAQVTILYEHTEALIRLQDLLKLPTATDNRVRIVVKQLDFNNKEKNMCVIFWQKA